MTERLTILVLAKHAVDPETVVVDPLDGQPDPLRLGHAPDPASLQAAAWALAARDFLAAAGWPARVVAVVAGPADADETARHLLALGVDEAVRADVHSLAHDPVGTAAALALAAPLDGSVALVVAGATSIDRGSGTVPPAFAEIAGLPFAGEIELEAPTTALEMAPGAPGAPAVVAGSVTFVVRDDVGRRVEARIALPAVLGIRTAAVLLPATTLERRLAAGRAAIPVVRVAGSGHHESSPSYIPPTLPPHLKPAPEGIDPDDRLVSLMSAGAASRAGQVVRGPVETLVESAVAFLVAEGFVGRAEEPPEARR